MSTPKKPQPVPRGHAQPRTPRSSKSSETGEPPIAQPEGGRRSDRDGRFEADHRPSR